jgi:hypothetical protein
VLVQQRTVEALDEAPGRPVFDVLKLEEQLIGVVVRAAAELAPFVAERCADSDDGLAEEGQNIVVGDLHGRERQRARVQVDPMHSG